MPYLSMPVISNRFRILFQDSISDKNMLLKMSVETTNVEFDFLNNTITLMMRQPVESMDMGMTLNLFGVAEDSRIDIQFMDLIGEQGGMRLSGLTKLSHKFKLDYHLDNPACHVVTWQFHVMESVSVNV